MTTDADFTFQRHGARGVSVVHAVSSMTWRFNVEPSKTSSSRSLLPSKAVDTPRPTSQTVPIRRSAYQFAVDEARRLDLID